MNRALLEKPFEPGQALFRCWMFDWWLEVFDVH